MGAITGESATLLVLGLSLLLAGKVLRGAATPAARRVEAPRDRPGAVLKPRGPRPEAVALVD
ncbi:MAG TPA: hypothetical protein VK886_18960 [Vicinamibacterales bacterium]|nr:hypothetical protein [Vicinamibacterales bacterium]